MERQSEHELEQLGGGGEGGAGQLKEGGVQGVAGLGQGVEQVQTSMGL